jgi:hypothetical protein
MDQLLLMDPRDREELLSLNTDRLLGHIIRLNRCARYHNTLDAVRLVSRLIELKGRTHPASSPQPTASSDQKKN